MFTHRRHRYAATTDVFGDSNTSVAEPATLKKHCTTKYASTRKSNYKQVTRDCYCTIPLDEIALCYH